MATPTRTILLDADIVAYQIASTSETKVDWGDGEVQQFGDDPELIESRLDQNIGDTKRKLRADEVIVCLTDAVNFRHSVLPSYKGNRKDLIKPLHLAYAKEYMERTQRTYKKPGLEADDVMGILATHPKIIQGKKVIVSIDKDMKQIPGWLYNPNKMTKPTMVTKEEGDRFHLFQTLTGDTVDGYYGCPDVGKVTAEELLESPYLEVPYEYEFKRGPRKGLTETRWEKTPTDSIWKAIVSQYEKKGLTEADALVQARVAKICQWQDYDYTNNEVILWTP